MKHSMHIELSSENIAKITAHFPSRIYKTNSTLYYEGQIPISGYLIVIGSIQLSKNKKCKKLLSSGTLVGFKELISRSPSTVSVEVFPNTQVCFLDETTILEVCNKVDSELSTLLKKLLMIQA